MCVGVWFDTEFNCANFILLDKYLGNLEDFLWLLISHLPSPHWCVYMRMKYVAFNFLSPTSHFNVQVT